MSGLVKVSSRLGWNLLVTAAMVVFCFISYH